VTVLGDTSATEQSSSNAPGYYIFDLTQAETNADKLMFSAKSSTSNIAVLAVPSVVYTTPANFTKAVIDASGLIDANAVKVGPSGSGTAQTARDLGASVLLSSGTGTGQVSLSSGKVLLQPTQTGVTIPIVTTLTNAPSDSSGVTTLLSRIPSGLFTGITSLAQWLGLLAGKQTGNSTALTEIKATGAGSGTYDPTTDSQEAIRDRGDAAWPTATGFSTLDAGGVRDAVGLASADLDTQLGAIKAKTDNLPSDPADESLVIAATDSILSKLGTPAGADVSADIAAAKSAIDGVKAVTDSLPDGGALSSLATSAGVAALPSAGDVADAVWDEATEDHQTAGSTGKALSDAGAAGTPPTVSEIVAGVYDEALSGHTTAGTAGKVLSDTGVAAAAIQAKTDNLPASPAAVGSEMALTSDYDAAKSAASATNLAAVKTVVDAVKLKTDNLPGSPAAVGSEMVLTSDYDAAKTASSATSVSAVKTVVDAVQAKTDNLPASPAATGAAMTLTSGERTSIASSVWSALTSGLTTVGSIGKKLADWALGTDNRALVSANTHTSGATVAAVSGGVGGDVTGSVGSLATQAKADVNAEVDAAIADAALATSAMATAIKERTDRLPDSPAPSGEAATAVADVGLTSAVTGRIDVAVSTRAPESGGNLAAVRTQTDKIPASPAATSDIPSASDVATAVLTSAADDPIAANVKKINDVTVDGDGSTTGWGAAS
jgi:hypothetical protein